MLVALVGFTVAGTAALTSSARPSPAPGRSRPGTSTSRPTPAGRGCSGPSTSRGTPCSYPTRTRTTAVEGLLAGGIDALYVFPPEFAENGVVVKVEEEQAGIGDFDGGGGSRALRNFILSNLYAEQVGDGEVERLLNPLRALGRRDR